jgi:peptidoglycan hydrolase CwlO-like protein
VDDDANAQDEIERLRGERDEWRRRAEVAEAVAAERLARAEAAERALATAETALSVRASASGGGGAAAASPEPPPRPRSLLERWRRYTDTIN